MLQNQKFGDLMKFGSRPLAAAFLLGVTALTSGCAVMGPHTDEIQTGNITLLTVDGPAHLTHFTPFHNSIYVNPMDGRQNFSDEVNDVLRRDGFDVVMQRDTSILLSTSEQFAGPADQFKPAPSETSGLSVIDYGRLGLQGALCAALHTCTDALVMTNAVQGDVDAAAMNRLGHEQGDARQANKTAKLLVVSRICSMASCGASYASTSDPSVTLDQLREANASIGIPHVLRAEPK